MKTIILFFSLAFLFLNCNTSGYKKNTDDSLHVYPPTPATIDRKEFRHYYRELNEFFDTSLLKKGFNGGILVARNGAIIYEKYQGLTDLRKKSRPVVAADSLNDSVPMHIASISKTLTATAILRMIEAGKFSINDTITRFFPVLPYPGITVNMLLTHRSGLPNYLYFMSDGGWDKKVFASNQDVLDYMVKKKPDKSFQPGTRFNYCNTNYLLLALIIEKISGKSFPDYMQEEIFAPLQMNHTYVFTLNDTMTSTPTFTNKETWWDFDFLDGIYGDKNVYSTPRDLLKFDQALYAEKLLRPTLLDSAFAGYIIDRKDSSGKKLSHHNYGLGWRLQLLPNGKKIVYHFGKWHGCNAVFARLTDEKVTIIIIGNKFNRSIYMAGTLCYDIFGNYLQRQMYEDEENDSLSAEKTIKKPVKKIADKISPRKPRTKTKD